MLNVLGLEPKQKEQITAIYNILSDRYKAEIYNDKTDLFNDHLAEFDLIKSFSAYSIKNIFRIPDGKLNHFVVIAYTADVATGNKKTHIKAKCITYGYTELSKEGGHVMVRPERLSDKIVDIFTKRELDFDSHPQFSRKYYVLTRNKALTDRMFTYELLDRINQFKKIFVEICDERLLITYNTEMPPESVIELVEFIKDADSLLKV